MRFLFCLSIQLILLSGCRKDLLQWRSAERIHTGSYQDLNTALILPNGTYLIGAGSRFGAASVLISENEGKDWQERQLPDDSKGLYGAAASPDGKVWCCGFGLNIYKSGDLFHSWEHNRVAGPYVFSSSISVPSDNCAFIALSATTDTGGIAQCDSNFRLIRYTPLNRAMRDIHMFNARSGMAVGSGICVRTDDSGNSWQTLPLKGDNFTALFALDSLTIYVCGLSGYIFKSTDGGLSWRRLRNGGNITYPQYKLWDIYFRNAQEGFAAGEHGVLLYTMDSGEHWSEFERFTRAHLYFIRPLSSEEWLSGGEGGTLYRLKR